MDEKTIYESPVNEVISFAAEDIVTSSGGFDGEVDDNW